VKSADTENRVTRPLRWANEIERSGQTKKERVNLAGAESNKTKNIPKRLQKRLQTKKEKIKGQNVTQQRFGKVRGGKLEKVEKSCRLSCPAETLKRKPTIERRRQ